MKYNRMKEIENYIMENETVTLDDLCRVFNVSKNTIRRDVKLLIEKGNISKIYGGVTTNDSSNLLSFFEERIAKNIAAKEKIGQSATAFVNDNDVIFIDSGTTTFQMIKYLRGISNLTVITNNLEALTALQQIPSIDVISIGGVLIRKTSSFAGINTVQMLQNYNISKCFMSATGVSISSGLTNSTTPEFELKRAVIQKSSQVFLLADSTKFDVASLMTYSPLEAVDYVMSDKTLPSVYLDFFEKHNIKLVV